MIAPSIQEALFNLVEAVEASIDLDRLPNAFLKRIDAAKASLATLQPDGERREAIARLLYKSRGMFDDETVRMHFEWFHTDKTASAEHRSSIIHCYRDAYAILASGFVQNEAGEPTTAMIDAGVAFALSVSLSGEYRWSQYVADLYKTMRAAAIRSARDGDSEI
ncbi:hypothetical protein [Nitrobacter sp. TKz-YC02]|uniref:hypothetical protein n=1 Tax=Nitrobacter sp. TKz-YC02 TaxID=3398704 RepID=UPI003CF027FD